MNKRLITTIGTHQLRGALFIVLLFVSINLIWIAQGQPSAGSKPLVNSETPSNQLRNVNGAKTVVRVHDTAERPQIALPQQNYRFTSARSPSGEICGYKPLPAHTQVAPTTHG